MDIEETKGIQNSKRKHKVTIFKRKSMINSIFTVSNSKGILNEKTESRRNSFSNRNETVEECKEDLRNQIESPLDDEQEKFHDVTFMKKDTVKEEKSLTKPPLPPVYENRFSGTESNRSEISLQDQDIVSVLNEPNIIITNNDDESFSSLVAKRLMLNEKKETNNNSTETVIKQKSNVLSLLVQKQIEFVKNKPNSKSSATLPDTFSSSDKNEKLVGLNMENSISNYKKLKTTSLSNSSASVHFDSTIKKIKTKLYDTKNKNTIPKLDYSNPQEVKGDENVCQPIETSSLGSSHDFSRAEQNDLTNHRTEWSTLNDKISSTLNHMSTETYKDLQSLEVKHSCADKTHDFVAKYKNRSLGRSIDASNNTIKSLKKIIFMNKAVGVLGRPVKNGILSKAKEILNIDSKGDSSLNHRKNSKSTIILLKKKSENE